MKKFLKYAVAAAMAAGILSGCGKENLASDAQPASVNAASSKEIRASEADEGVLNLVQGPGEPLIWILQLWILCGSTEAVS